MQGLSRDGTEDNSSFPCEIFHEFRKGKHNSCTERSPPFILACGDVIIPCEVFRKEKNCANYLSLLKRQFHYALLALTVKRSSMVAVFYDWSGKFLKHLIHLRLPFSSTKSPLHLWKPLYVLIKLESRHIKKLKGLASSPKQSQGDQCRHVTFEEECIFSIRLIPLIFCNAKTFVLVEHLNRCLISIQRVILRSFLSVFIHIVHTSPNRIIFSAFWVNLLLYSISALLPRLPHANVLHVTFSSSFCLFFA